MITNEYISREAVEQVLCGIANGLSVGETEALKAKDVKALYKIKGAKEILDTIDNDLCFIPEADVQPIVYAHKTINVGRRSYCSNCRKLAIMEDFCSKCGAKVKDDDVDNNTRNLTDEETDIYDDRLETEAKTIGEISLL